MNLHPALLATLSGLASGLLFLLALMGFSGGILFIFLPLIPLFMLGYARGLHATIVASLAALFVTLLLTGFAGALNFALLIGLPAIIFIRQALWWRELDGEREWYPLLAIALPLTGFVAATFLFNSLMAMGEPGGLEGLAGEVATQALKSTPSGAGGQFAVDLSGWMFLIFGLSAWMMVPLIYLMAWLSHAALAARVPLKRPHFSLEYAEPPIGWLLALVGVGLLSFLDGPLGFTGKVLFIMMLVPYFLNGFVLFHGMLKRWVGSGWIIAIIYIFLMINPVFLLLITGWGLIEQWFRLSHAGDSGRRTD